MNPQIQNLSREMEMIKSSQKKINDNFIMHFTTIKFYQKRD